MIRLGCFLFFCWGGGWGPEYNCYPSLITKAPMYIEGFTLRGISCGAAKGTVTPLLPSTSLLRGISPESLLGA